MPGYDEKQHWSRASKKSEICARLGRPSIYNATLIMVPGVDVCSYYAASSTSERRARVR